MPEAVAKPKRVSRQAFEVAALEWKKIREEAALLEKTHEPRKVLLRPIIEAFLEKQPGKKTLVSGVYPISLREFEEERFSVVQAKKVLPRAVLLLLSPFISKVFQRQIRGPYEPSEIK